jgi:hypothetical protein
MARAGMIAHQATCVAIAGRAVLIEGPPGSGKSALALALIDRGATLVGDDGVMLGERAGHLLATPHPRTRGLIEIRNLGLVPCPVVDAAFVALVVTLDPDAPRFIEKAGEVARAGLAVPQVALWPDAAPPALKVEHALRLFGLHT